MTNKALETFPDSPGATENDSPLAESFSYEQLKGHATTDGTWRTDEQLRMEYITRTDTLIHKMTDGVSFMNPETHKYEKARPDYVIFLDKSARPLAWFVRDLWDKLAPEPGSDKVPGKPEFRFLNIDRQQWVNVLDPEGVGSVEVNKLDKSILRSLRSVFIAPKDKRDGLTDKIDDAPADLDGKRVLIVDEVKSTGRTLTYAQSMLKAAFPTARFATTYWMDGMVTLKNGNEWNADLPVWYRETSVYGRGVGNRSENKDHASRSSTQKLGAWFLSTRFPKVDKASLQLRRELAHLASSPDVPIIPSLDREIDDYEARLAALNGGDAAEAQRRMREIGRVTIR